LAERIELALNSLFISVC